MRNRITQHFHQCFPLVASRQDRSRNSQAESETTRPTLLLGDGDTIKVDMERFFDFSFSFAEALLGLEDQFSPSHQTASSSHLQMRELSVELLSKNPDRDNDSDFEIDARWM